MVYFICNGGRFYWSVMNNRFIITINVDKDAINFCNVNHIFGKWLQGYLKVK